MPNISFSPPTKAFPLLHILRTDRLDPQSPSGGMFSCDPTEHGRCLGADTGYPEIGDDLERFTGVRVCGDYPRVI